MVSRKDAGCLRRSANPIPSTRATSLHINAHKSIRSTSLSRYLRTGLTFTPNDRTDRRGPPAFGPVIWLGDFVIVQWRNFMTSYNPNPSTAVVTAVAANTHDQGHSVWPRRPRNATAKGETAQTANSMAAKTPNFFEANWAGPTRARMQTSTKTTAAATDALTNNARLTIIGVSLNSVYWPKPAGQRSTGRFGSRALFWTVFPACASGFGGSGQGKLSSASSLGCPHCRPPPSECSMSARGSSPP